MCAKYSDFLCIWLRKCDFLTGKVRYWPDPDPKLFIPDPDPAKSSGSGSTTLRIGKYSANRGPNMQYRRYTGIPMKVQPKTTRY